MFLRTLVVSLSVLGGLSAIQCNGRIPAAGLTCSMGIQIPPSGLPVTWAAYTAMAAASDQFEIQSGQIALVKASSADIRNYAQMLINDHTSTTAQLTSAAISSGLAAPIPVLTADQQQMLNELQVAPAGLGFDQLFLRDQVMAHEMALAVHSNYAANGDIPALRTVAAGAVPIVQMHLGTAEQLLVSSGAMMASDFCPQTHWCNSDVDAFGQNFAVCCPSDVPVFPPLSLSASIYSSPIYASAPATTTTVYAPATTVYASAPIYASAPASTIYASAPATSVYAAGSGSLSAGYIRAFGTVVPAVRVPSNSAGGLYGNVPVGTPATPIYSYSPVY